MNNAGSWAYGTNNIYVIMRQPCKHLHTVVLLMQKKVYTCSQLLAQISSQALMLTSTRVHLRHIYMYCLYLVYTACATMHLQAVHDRPFLLSHWFCSLSIYYIHVSVPVQPFHFLFYNSCNSLCDYLIPRVVMDSPIHLALELAFDIGSHHFLLFISSNPSHITFPRSIAFLDCTCNCWWNQTNRTI